MRVHALIGQNYYSITPNAYRDYCVAVLQRYGPGGAFKGGLPITSVELMNEAWGPNKSPTAYMTFIKPALLALQTYRKMGVKVVVMVASKGANHAVPWINSMYKALPKLNAYVDGFAVHPYWNGHSPSAPSKSLLRPFSFMDSVRAAMNCHGGNSKGIYVTEYGCSTFKGVQGVTIQQQKSYLSTFMSAVKSNSYGWRVVMFSIYELSSFDPSVYWNPQAAQALKEREANFGILDKFGKPKPAFSAYTKYRGIKNSPVRAPHSSMKGKKVYGACSKKRH